MRKKLTIAAVALSATALLGGIGFGVAAANGGDGNPPPPAGAGPRVAPNISSPSKYVAVTPCRIADTRQTTPLAVGVDRSFYVAGTFGFAPQGGTSGGCGIPTYATSVTVTLSSTAAGGKGFLRAYPTGGATPTATALNYTNLTDLSVGATEPLGSGGKLSARAYGAPTDLVIDVTGYYEPPIAGIWYSDSSAYSTSRLTMSTHPSTGNYTLTADRSLSTCVVNASAWDGYLAAAYASGSTVYVRVTQNGTNVNAYFQVSVTC